VLPGRVTDRQSWGALRLIQDGAKLVCSPAEIVAEFPEIAAALQQAEPGAFEAATLPDLTDPERRLWSLMDADPKHVDELIETSGMTAAQVLSTLLVLEMKRLVRQHPGKLFTRTNP